VSAIGFEHEQLIDQQSLRELVPAVSPDCVGAIVVKGDGFANPFQTMRAFYQKCQRLGVIFHEGCRVERIERINDHWAVHTKQTIFSAQCIVNCAGAWGGHVADMLGDKLPVTAGAPMLMITDRMPAFFDGVAGAEGFTLSFKQFPNGTVLIGGGHVGKAIASRNKTTLNLAGLASYAATARRYFPIMAKAKIVRCWAGIEGFMPDGIPVLGRGQAENVFHSVGYSAHGYQMGPICGRIISELILDENSALPIEPFSAGRFSTDPAHVRGIG
jgi:sarcosine oxidase subunit beta